MEEGGAPPAWRPGDLVSPFSAANNPSGPQRPASASAGQQQKAHRYGPGPPAQQPPQARFYGPSAPGGPPRPRSAVPAYRGGGGGLAGPPPPVLPSGAVVRSYYHPNRAPAWNQQEAGAGQGGVGQAQQRQPAPPSLEAENAERLTARLMQATAGGGAGPSAAAPSSSSSSQSLRVSLSGSPAERWMEVIIQLFDGQPVDAMAAFVVYVARTRALDVGQLWQVQNR